MRYRPSIVAPSGPYDTCPDESLRIAIVCPARSSVPMNFNGIGGTGGGGGGPVGIGLITGGGGRCACGGGALRFYPDRLRSAPPGLRRSAPTACRCTCS